MKMLLLNTCSAGLESGGVAALAEADRIEAAEALPGRGTGEQLLPVLRRLFAGVGWTPEQLGCVGVVVGPGSFTGVRVGLSAAKGLCEAAGAKMIAMSRLELLAGAARVAVLDAGRGEFYLGVRDSGGAWRERLAGSDEARHAVRESGSAVTCEQRVQHALGPDVKLLEEPGAEAMLAVVQVRAAAGAWSDIALTDANYLRRTDAELMAKGRG